MLVGEVHDNYAAALGGVAGHSGLFGTAGAVGLVRACVAARSRAEMPTIPSPLSPRTRPARHAEERRPRQFARPWLGHHAARPRRAAPSCRRRPSAIVGFTGTSLWIDPILDRYFVLLT